MSSLRKIIKSVAKIIFKDIRCLIRVVEDGSSVQKNSNLGPELKKIPTVNFTTKLLNCDSKNQDIKLLLTTKIPKAATDKNE